MANTEILKHNFDDPCYIPRLVAYFPSVIELVTCKKWEGVKCKISFIKFNCYCFSHSLHPKSGFVQINPPMQKKLRLAELTAQ